MSYLSKPTKIPFALFSLSCLAAIAACAIVDLAINRQLTWTRIVLVSVVYAWLITALLLLSGRHRIPLLFLGITLFTIPFLYLLEKTVPVTGWFSSLALPCGIIGLLLLWLIYLLFRLLPISSWYKAAGTAVLVGIASPFIIRYVDAFLGTGPSLHNLYSNIAACVLLAVIFTILGIVKSRRV